MIFYSQCGSVFGEVCMHGACVLFSLLAMGVMMNDVNDEKEFLNMPVVSPEQVIAQLATDMISLRESAFQILQEKEALQEIIDKLEKKPASSVPFEYFSSYMKEMIHSGKIPVPKEVLAFGLPVTVTCNPENVHFRHGNIVVEVAFSVHEHSLSLFQFIFHPIPRYVENGYPDFHMGYTKVTPVTKKKTRIKKPRVLAEKPEDASVTTK